MDLGINCYLKARRLKFVFVKVVFDRGGWSMAANGRFLLKSIFGGELEPFIGEHMIGKRSGFTISFPFYCSISMIYGG